MSRPSRRTVFRALIVLTVLTVAAFLGAFVVSAQQASQAAAVGVTLPHSDVDCLPLTPAGYALRIAGAVSLILFSATLIVAPRAPAPTDSV